MTSSSVSSAYVRATALIMMYQQATACNEVWGSLPLMTVAVTQGAT